MESRDFWLERISNAWKKRSIVWLTGVRRVGKTTLVKMIPEATFLNCDLPSVQRQVSDPELFFQGIGTKGCVIFDEIHRLPDPTLILKIAADEYSHLKILATGSSTLSATRKFKDSLTGRKASLFLPPVLWSECREGFDGPSLERRLLHGGLPEQLLAKTPDSEFFAEWLDSFYARDIQELFGIRERTGFLNLLSLMLRQSGGQVDYSALARESGLSRMTVKSHLEAMTVACALFPLPPFHGHGRREILKRPKVYAFDTGFVAFSRGWERLRPQDLGILWEHLVLDLLRVQIPSRDLFYWRDKSGREIDFVIRRPGNQVDAIECKVHAEAFRTDSLRVFRQAYPEGKNLLLTPTERPTYLTRFGEFVVSVGSAKSILSR